MAVKGGLILLGLVAAAAGQSCVAPFVLVGGKCFYMEASEQGSSYNWQEARDYCKALAGDLNGDLASFPTCDEYTQFARYLALNAPTNTTLWMGARTAFTVNMWQWVTLEALETGVPFWYYGEDFHAANECAAADGAHYYRLVASDCNDQKAFACSYTPATSFKERQEHKVERSYRDIRAECPNEGLVIGDYCYIFKNGEENYEDAERKCRDEHNEQGGELYYPSSCHEFTHMAHHLETSEDNRRFWVGAIDISGEEEWFWVNGVVVPGGLPYWASGHPSHNHENQPREHCGTMHNQMRFYLSDSHCSDRNSYICKLQLV